MIPAKSLTFFEAHETPPPAVAPEYAALADIPRGGGGIDALYVHVPFCATKCHYCDFYSFAGHLDRVPAYLEALGREIEMQAELFAGGGRFRPRTLFIGGGTPTLLGPAELERLLGMLGRHVDIGGVEEFTVEANPNTFDDTRARVLAAGGVNRISFGAQSFHAAELRMLERDHDPESVEQAFGMARRSGIENLNIDLIFGTPGQTLESWDYSLTRALALGPAHLSCYSLTYESNTAMTARLRRGEFERLDEETELAMFERVFCRLREAGFVRYETSNFARRIPAASPGATDSALVCRHNLLYWKAGNWLGLGPSAGSHVTNGIGDQAGGVAWQWKNVGSLAHYVEALRADGGGCRVPAVQMETMGRGKWAAGVAVFWLRLAEGLNFREFKARTGVDPEGTLRAVLGPFVDLGLVEMTAALARVTDRGVPVSNHILARVLAAFERIKSF